MTDTLKLFFFDTETTGTNPKVNRIIQFWWIWWEYDYQNNIFRETRRINQYINVDTEIPKEVTKITWITNKDLIKYWYISNYIEEFLVNLKNADYVIWHNVEFDKNMIIEEAKRCNIKFDSNKIKWIDTMKATTDLVKIPNKYWPYKYKWPKLQELYKFLFNRTFSWAHDAMNDILATKDCFIYLCMFTNIFDDIIPTKPKVITEHVAKKFIDWKVSKEALSKCEWITVEGAKIISNYKWSELFLNKIKEIDYKIAEALSNYKWENLSLWWVRHINKETAKYLALSNAKNLYLGCLEDSSMDIVTELSKFKWKHLWLTSWWFKLTPQTATEFAEHFNWILHIYPYRSGWRELSDYTITIKKAKELLKENDDSLCIIKDYIAPRVMKEIVKFKWKNLYLYLCSINEEMAKIIVKYKWTNLSFPWLENIDTNSAKIISYFWWDSLNFDNLEYIDIETAAALSKFKWFCLDISWLKRIAPEKAIELAKFQWKQLKLNGLEYISEKTAFELINFWWTEIWLRWLKEIDKDTAKVLSNFQWLLDVEDDILKKIERSKKMFWFF